MLIFDRFPSRDRADQFANYVRKEFGRKARTFDTQEESTEWDFFPFQLDPPIVMVERLDDYSGEQAIEKLVATFGGSFAGT